MASIGSYYVRVLPDMSKFMSSLSGGMASAGTTSGNVFGRTFLGFISRIAIGTTIGRIVTSGFNAIVGGFSTGIERLDIVENYPAILANMGIANEDAEASVQRLQEALLGLPTSLQDGVTATQRLTASLGDVDRGTDAFIAFNNALVAGMAPAELQSAALEQFAQAVSKGKPDMLEWRSMLNAMPGQMNQIAQSMGLTTDELGEGLRSGTIPMEDFLDEIIRLNEEGGEGFASFADQAHTATNTIGTAITNVGNRISAGWAAVLDVFGQSNIAQFINDFSTNVLAGFNQLAEGVRWLKYTILGSGLGEAIGDVMDAISEAFGIATSDLPALKDVIRGAVDFIVGALEDLADSGAIQAVGSIVSQIVGYFERIFGGGVITGWISGVLDAVEGVVSWIADSGIIDVILPAIIGALEVIAGLTIASWVMNVAGAASGLFAILQANPLWTLAGLIGGLILFLVNWIATTEEGQAAWKFFTDFLAGAWETITSAVQTMVENVQESWEKLKEGFAAVVANVASFLEELILVIFQIADIIITFFVDFATNLYNVVSTIVESIITFFSELPGNLANIWENIKTTASNAWANLRDNVVNKVTSVKTRVTEIFGNLRSSVSTAWTNIKKAITDPINAARDNVQKAINKIKGFFSFSISWPHIPVPYFSITPSGWQIGDLLKGSIPSLSIGWKGTGGMFNGAQLYAVGVGERGAELVWPSYEPYLSKYGNAIADAMGKNGSGVTNNYYIDGNLVAADAVLASALDTVATRINGRSRMGTVR